MSGSSKNTTIYSASDLQRYLKGEMSALEMHHLEMAALEDPFLADALEGFEKRGTSAPMPAQTGDETLSGHLYDLRSRLDTRVSAPEKLTPAPEHTVGHAKVAPIRTPWLRIAAAVILLIGLGAGVWYGLPNKKQEADLLSKQKAPAATPAPADIPKSLPTAPIVRIEKKTPIRPPRTAHTTNSSGSGAPTLSPVIPGLSITPSHADSSTFTEAMHALVFSGKVLDIHDNPLPGATLFFAGSRDHQPIGAVTDGNGNFSLKIDPKDSLSKVTVGMVGYEKISLPFNRLNTDAFTGNTIRLTEQPVALSEVLVSGYGSKLKETRAMVPVPNDETLDSVWIDAKPLMGRQAYLDYLAFGKNTIGADTSVKGSVLISFKVTKKGELISFKVEQSLTPAHDAGVIHLISEGPPWEKVSKSRMGRTAVRVVF